MDIIVTTPKGSMKDAAREAEDAKQYEGTEYFRRLGEFGTYRNGEKVAAKSPVNVGERVYYVEDGFIRGFAIVSRVQSSRYYMTCDTTGREFEPGLYVFMRADSWKWIEPIPYGGFQGYRFLIDGTDLARQVRIVGDWLDPKPATGKELVAA